MNLKESIRKHLLLEKRIGQISTNFEVVFGFDIIKFSYVNKYTFLFHNYIKIISLIFHVKLIPVLYNPIF